MRKVVIVHTLSKDLPIKGPGGNVKNLGYSASTDGSKQEVNAPVLEEDKLQGGTEQSLVIY